MKLGCTGHQNIADPTRWPDIDRRFETILREHQPNITAVLTSLAAGADQHFAAVALRLGIPLEVIVPCADYESAFADPTSLATYRDLLSHAATVRQLPFDGPSEDAFLAAGLAVVDGCDVLVALWNGRPAAGKGGTGDVVAYAERVGRRWVCVEAGATPNLG